MCHFSMACQTKEKMGLRRGFSMLLPKHCWKCGDRRPLKTWNSTIIFKRSFYRSVLGKWPISWYQGKLARVQMEVTDLSSLQWDTCPLLQLVIHKTISIYLLLYEMPTSPPPKKKSLEKILIYKSTLQMHYKTAREQHHMNSDDTLHTRDF